MREKTKYELNRALRQFRHNLDDSPGIYPRDGFVTAYDTEAIDHLVERLDTDCRGWKEAARGLATKLVILEGERERDWKRKVPHGTWMEN